VGEVAEAGVEAEVIVSAVAVADAVDAGAGVLLEKMPERLSWTGL